MTTWRFFNPVRCLAGRGVRGRLAEFLPAGAVLLVTTPGMVARGTAGELTAQAPATAWTVRTVDPNPDLDTLDALARELRAHHFAAVVGFGGGSALDSAKVLAALLAATPSASLDAWLRAARPAKPGTALPCLCLPTTAGTGAEVTPFATVWDRRDGCKRSLDGEALFPRAALLDPEPTRSLPWETTLFTGLDALAHALETLWNVHATPASVALADRALALAAVALPRLRTDGDDLDHRETMQQAALLAGLAISQSRTALSHAMSYPLTMSFAMPHGLACGVTLRAILSRVRAAGKWAPGTDETAVAATETLLHSLDIPAYAARWCTLPQALPLRAAMAAPDRAGNFALPVDAAMLDDILRESLPDATAETPSC